MLLRSRRTPRRPARTSTCHGPVRQEDGQCVRGGPEGSLQARCPGCCPGQEVPRVCQQPHQVDHRQDLCSVPQGSRHHGQGPRCCRCCLVPHLCPHGRCPERRRCTPGQALRTDCV